jgi:hypothetical protein
MEVSYIDIKDKKKAACGTAQTQGRIISKPINEKKIAGNRTAARALRAEETASGHVPGRKTA